jgi:hypothetical protein
MRLLLALFSVALLGGIPIDASADGGSPFADMPILTTGSCTTEKQVTDYLQAQAGRPVPVFDFTASDANKFIFAANELFAASGSNTQIPPLLVDAAFSMPVPGGVAVMFGYQGCVGPLLLTTLAHYKTIRDLMDAQP